MAFSTNVPPQEAEIRFQPFYDNWSEIAKVSTLFRSWIGLQGEIIAVNESETGPNVASSLPETLPISAAGRPLGNFIPEVVRITASLTLRQSTHAGRVLYCVNSSAVILTISPTSDPATGIQNYFACTIIRGGTGTVQIGFVSTANRHPSSHTRITSGLSATLFYDGDLNEMFFLGGTEA